MKEIEHQSEQQKVNGMFITNKEKNRRKSVIEANIRRKIRDDLNSNKNVTGRLSSTAESGKKFKIKWNDGRRIVELDVLSKNLICYDCGKALNLCNTEDETRYGLASILYIACECGVTNSVATGKSHRVSNRGVPIYDVNTKAAAGKLLFN